MQPITFRVTQDLINSIHFVFLQCAKEVPQKWDFYQCFQPQIQMSALEWNYLHLHAVEIL